MANSVSACGGTIQVVLSNTGPQGPPGPSGPQGPPGPGGEGFRAQTLTDAETITWNASLGTIAKLTLGGNHALATPTNLIPGPYALIVTQGPPGQWDLACSTAYLFSDGVPPVLSQEEGQTDILTFT